MSVRDAFRSRILKTLGLSRQKPILSIFLGESLRCRWPEAWGGWRGAAYVSGTNSGTIFAALRLSLTPWLANVIICSAPQ